MLRLFRKRAKIILWCLIFGVGIPFILWGTGAGRRGLASRDYVGKIYGRKVSAAEFFMEKLAVNVLAELEGKRLPERVIDTAAWDRIMLIEEAKRLGLTASSGEIAAALGTVKAFMPGGRFSIEVYKWYLNRWRITPSDFESIVSDSILIDKLRRAIMSTALISDGEVRDIYSEQHERVSIRYALFPPAEEIRDIEVNDDELPSYYADKEGDFKVPEKVSIAYILIEAGKPEKIHPPTREEIEQFYRDNPELFRHGRRVKARQILIKALPGRDETEIGKLESKIRKIKAGTEKGKNFAKLAKKYSDDKETASSGGDLGYVEAHQLEKGLADVAFSLEVGQSKGPIETESGYYFIQVEDIQKPGIKGFDEVREEIAGLLQKERDLQASEEVDERSSQKALSLSLELIDEPDLAKIAKENGLPLKTAGPFSREEAPGDLPRELTQIAFDMPEGEISDAISIPDSGYAILTVVKKEEERIPQLSEIREKVIESYVKSLGREKAKEKAEESLERVEQLMEKKGIDFHSACSKLGIDTTVSQPLSIAGEIPGFGPSGKINEVIFSLPVGRPGPLMETKSGFVFFAPEKRIKPDLEPLKKNMERFKLRYLARKRIDEWLEWFRNAQAHAGAMDLSIIEDEE